MIDSNKIIRNWLEPATKDWFKRQCHNPYLAFYFYFKPTTESEDGALAISTEPFNDSWQLASPERISTAWTIDQVFNHCAGIARTLPFLPKDGDV